MSITPPLLLKQTLEQARTVLAIETEALVQLAQRLDEAFVQAVHALEAVSQQGGRIVVTGMGKSGHVGQKIAATLASTGSPAFFMHPAEGRHGDLGQITPHDAVIAISNSGESEEVLGLLPTLSVLGVPIIALTAKPHSTLARHASVWLDISVEREACPLALAPTASTTVTLALGDALAMVLMQRKPFAPQDFALYHPAGSLGKRLLLKVEMLMHQGEALPHCPLDQPFLEALVLMGAKKLGCLCIVNQAQELLGMITDGDCRRFLANSSVDALKQATVAEVMTPHPQTIARNALASEALQCMEQRKITVLPVVKEKTLVGVLHLHDVLNSGL